MRWRDRLLAAWYLPRLSIATAALLPLSWIFAAAVALRRAMYRHGLLAQARLPVPVIVVGNITAGGSGKTPLALALAEALAVRGMKPGVVSRGYGGRRDRQRAAPHVVSRGDDARDVGDEPLLYATAGFPVAIGRDRVAAARALLGAQPAVDVLIADDGLQHYRLARDCEIAVVDAARGLGNRRLLPAGPLREPPSRMRQVTLIVVTSTARADKVDVAIGAARGDVPVFVQRLEPSPSLHRVDDPGTIRPVSELAAVTVHAVAGIGDPQRFFDTLRALGLDAIPHPFPDHHPFEPRDIAFDDTRPIVMTAKDAVKCRRFASARCYYLPVRARIDAALADSVEKTIHGPEAP